jgi:hypothetical protein
VPGESALRKAAAACRAGTIQSPDVEKDYLFLPEGVFEVILVLWSLKEVRAGAKVFQNEMGRSVSEHRQGDEL